jgi:hypothetical protein
MTLPLTVPPIRPREIRRIAGVSLADAARQVQRSPSTVRKYERDATTVSRPTAALLASWYLHQWYRLQNARTCKVA